MPRRLFFVPFVFQSTGILLIDIACVHTSAAALTIGGSRFRAGAALALGKATATIFDRGRARLSRGREGVLSISARRLRIAASVASCSRILMKARITNRLMATARLLLNTFAAWRAPCSVNARAAWCGLRGLVLISHFVISTSRSPRRLTGKRNQAGTGPRFASLPGLGPPW